MAARSEEAVASALSTVLRDHGWAAASSARRLRGALSDVLGAESDEHRGVLDALVLAVEEGVVRDLREAGRDGVGTVLPDLVARMAEWGLTGERATWAVRTWADLLPEPTKAPPMAPTVAPTMAPPDLTTAPPDTRPEALAPTTLPPMVTAAPGPPARRSRRQAALVAAVVGVALVAGGAAAAVNWSGDNPDPGPSQQGSGSADATTPAEDPPPEAEAGTVVTAAGVNVPVADEGVAMAAADGGVRITRLGEVETAGSGDDERSAPEGGRLLAFKLANWPCERGSCRPWSRLGLRISVGGDERRLPAAGPADAFVVAVPADVTDVDLVMKADRLTQSLSLVTGEPGPDNVEVLARAGRVDRIGERFTLTERTSEAINYGSIVTDTVPLDVKVTRAELSFFTEHGRPSAPQLAFLKLRAAYTIPFGASPGPFAFDLGEIEFVARDGTSYEARDIDKGPGLNVVFEVPADLRGGAFRLGGGSYPATSDGQSFTRTLAERKVSVSFG